MRKEKINIDLYKKTYNKRILKQFDTTEISIKLYDKGTPCDLQNKTFKYIFKRIDGSIIRDVGTVESSEIIFNLDERCLQLSGQAELEVQMYEEENLISSFVIEFEIEHSNMDNAEASDKGLYLQDIDSTFRQIQQDIIQFEQAETLRVAAEEQREELTETMQEDVENAETLIETIETKLENGELNGPANVLRIGSVISGQEAAATIVGDSPSQILNLVLPKGDKGDKGEAGAKRRNWS